MAELMKTIADKGLDATLRALFSGMAKNSNETYSMEAPKYPNKI